MKYRNLGKAGLKISEIALGGWLTYGATVEIKLTKRIVSAAIDSGINFIDIADIYSKGRAEELMGQAIKGITRSDLVISSKLFWPMSGNVNDRGLSRKHIMESVEKSLKRIGTDYLDIYFCHRFDPETGLLETVRAMDDLVRQGKILYWGTSLWTAAQIQQAIEQVGAVNGYLPSVEQPRYNMFDRQIELEIMPLCRRYGIGLTVWSPLAQGLLTGKYNDGTPPDSRGGTSEWLKNDLTDDNLARVRKLAELAASLDISVSQLALAWILRRNEISCAITGATSEKQVIENVIASDISLSGETVETIETILGNNPNKL